MKEVMVAKLDKEDLARLKEGAKAKKELNVLRAQLISSSDAFWAEVDKKYSLSCGVTHYIKDNAIYKQEV